MSLSYVEHKRRYYEQCYLGKNTMEVNGYWFTSFFILFFNRRKKLKQVWKKIIVDRISLLGELSLWHNVSSNNIGNFGKYVFLSFNLLFNILTKNIHFITHPPLTKVQNLPHTWAYLSYFDSYAIIKCGINPSKALRPSGMWHKWSQLLCCCC